MNISSDLNSKWRSDESEIAKERKLGDIDLTKDLEILMRAELDGNLKQVNSQLNKRSNRKKYQTVDEQKKVLSFQKAIFIACCTLVAVLTGIIVDPVKGCGLLFFIFAYVQFFATFN